MRNVRGMLAAAAGRLRPAPRRRGLTVASEELDDANLRFERIFLEAPIGMALTDERGCWLRVNPPFCAMLGYGEHELQGQPIAALTHPQDREHHLQTLAELFEGRRSVSHHEKRYTARDGSEIWALVSVSLIPDWHRGRPVGLVQLQDITERKRAEDELARERQLFNSFLQTTPSQIYFKDLDGRFIRVSDVQARKLGFMAPEEAIGKTDFDAFSDEHAVQAFEDEQKVIRTGQSILDLEERETFPDGREAWVSTSKMPLKNDRGAIIGTFGISRDVTLQKRAEQAIRDAEERWRTLLANSQEIAWLVNDEGLLTYVSPSIRRWLGHDPDDLIGSALGLVTHPNDRAALAAALERVGPEHPESVGYRAQHKDGTWHSLESTVVSLRDDPAVSAVLIASRDVTEHVTLEEQRARLERERRVSQRLEAVGQLSAGIAHEINTPLQFVSDSVVFLKEAVRELLGLTDMYRGLLKTDEPLNQLERRQRADAAEQEADLEYLQERIPIAFERTVEGVSRVTSIVHAMKRFSHTSSSDMAPADLNEAIETTLAVSRNEYKYVAEIALELGELPLVTCNAGELNQMFLNLIINAAQAIEEERGRDSELGTIKISTRRDGDEVLIEIADNGPGIPLELQDRIYEPFFTTKEIGKGSGQGLALARTTMDRHSGSIECASAPGQGTKFAIRLPLEPPGQARQEAA